MCEELRSLLKNPLHYSAANNHATAVRAFLKNSTDVNAADDSGWTTLHHAGWYGHKTIVELLCRSSSNGIDVFHVDVVRILMSRGADIQLKDKDGQTALESVRREEIKILFEK